jgi:hypothetical protein
MTSQRPGKSSPQVTGARAAAQRAKLDAQAEASRSAQQEAGELSWSAQNPFLKKEEDHSAWEER